MESEQNGLITYDREISKLPIDTIRKIQEILFKNSGRAIETVKIGIAPEKEQTYSEKLMEFNEGRRDSSFLRNLALSAKGKKDYLNMIRIADEYVNQMNDLSIETNARFLLMFTKATDSKCFKVLQTNMNLIDSVLGRDKAWRQLTFTIQDNDINPLITNNKNIDWDALEKSLRKKYGTLGEDALKDKVMWETPLLKDWTGFKKFAKSWHETIYPKHASYDAGIVRFINQTAWSAFEQCDDREVLLLNVDILKPFINDQTNPQIIDTYANLLYKLGDKENAIRWEELAVKKLNSSTNNEIFITLQKMKRGEKTWPEK